jgi:hypothetical protein
VEIIPKAYLRSRNFIIELLTARGPIIREGFSRAAPRGSVALTEERKMNNDRKTYEFLVGSYDGEYLAISEVEPFFCLVKPTEDQAIKAALAAFELYAKHTSKHAPSDASAIRVERKYPLKVFAPTERILAAG